MLRDELIREEIRFAERVAGPGCRPGLAMVAIMAGTEDTRSGVDETAEAIFQQVGVEIQQ
jgi:N-acetyl-gamma-glutamylphosphate reductase